VKTNRSESEGGKWRHTVELGEANGYEHGKYRNEREKEYKFGRRGLGVSKKGKKKRKLYGAWMKVISS
jgi:hypothetical protein